ncbi:HepT-like ribonuclease domain-containing protein [Agromyces bauzanensis]
MIEDYAKRTDDDDIVFDAIRIRLVEIGEAVKDLDPSVTAPEPGIPWEEIAQMRDQLAHRYFDTSHAIVMATARNNILTSGPLWSACSTANEVSRHFPMRGALGFVPVRQPPRSGTLIGARSTCRIRDLSHRPGK